MDFFKTGILITIIMMAIILTMVPWLYPL